MVKIDQALIQAYIDGSFGLPIAYENDGYTPTPGNEYSEIYTIPNDITPFSMNDSNETDGVFRVILRYPVDCGSIEPKKKADEIFAVFFVGRVLKYENQKVTISGLSRMRGIIEGGWYQLPLSIMYRAFLPR